MKKRLLVTLMLCCFIFLNPVVSKASEESTFSTLDSSMNTTELSENNTSIEETKEVEETLVSETESSSETETSSTTETTEETENELELKEEEINQYLSLKNNEVVIYKDKDLSEVIEHQLVLGQTFLAKEKLTDIESEKVYYSLFDYEDVLIGYIEGTEVEFADNKGGVKQEFKEYSTILKAEGQLLADFDGKIKAPVSSIFKSTVLIKAKHHHFDDTIYYSIYDNKDRWLGYIKEENVKLAGQNKQGVHQGTDQFVVIRSGNYSIWQNFTWKKKYDSKQFLNRTFKVQGEYHHFNGDIYYSLYDLAGTWYGYINKTGTNLTKEAQGDYVSFRKYVTVKNGNQSIWSNFSWKKKYGQKELAGETLFAKGIYYHANGNDYYSLYDKDNKWHGYINKNFVSVAPGKQGTYQSFGKYVTITNGNYETWQNFNWKQRSTTKNMKNKTYHAKGKYKHFNGRTYYSLFDSKGNWYGYVNSNVAKIGDGQQGIYQPFGKDVTIAKRDYPMWRNFSWVKKDNTSNHFNKKLKARGKYEHFNGSTYYSLYDNAGKWYGYLNAKATAQDAEKIAKVQQLLNRKYASPNFGIYVMSLEDGSVASMNGNKTFTAASTGKLPAMYYTQKMINEKKIDPNRKYLYQDAINQMPIYSYMRGGAGILQGKPFGTYYSLDTMLNWTAKYSDNQGANFLGYYGANQYELKMRNEVSRIIGRQWISPFQVTAKENALLIAEMNKQGGQVMRYMQNTVFDNQRIPKYLPVKVAHKIGDVGSYVHDVAIVYTDRPYVLSVMTQNGQSYETISVLSKEIYDIMK
ncbi:serine hydrolase [Vagococcus fluvialis]|uniref:serine hydrolase n=1 Tax=Vagococcus fluvialis TaxID=2738 RepID=UPI001432B115|nr:serine hydrolase [Vagococcus fluvialis]NKC60938.1 serine hydrolase [Vagococcus fluvialis]NKD51842.1 serine hydrolase [Vagococcus fluvialis]